MNGSIKEGFQEEGLKERCRGSKVRVGRQAGRQAPAQGSWQLTHPSREVTQRGLTVLCGPSIYRLPLARTLSPLVGRLHHR